jgi:hypothetical protein
VKPEDRDFIFILRGMYSNLIREENFPQDPRLENTPVNRSIIKRVWKVFAEFFRSIRRDGHVLTADGTISQRLPNINH